jgi:hypothetical protein
MTNWNLFDQYSFRARLQPALLTLLPAAIGIFALTGPGVKWQSALWTLFGTAGGTYFLAILARNFGKQIEPGLWQSWGGAPTTQLLRHSGPANPVMRERWHKTLSKLLGRPFPSPQEEAANPACADDIYNAAVKLQIGKTRDTKKYRLLYNENVNYGFCRNLYAMKIMGIVVAVLGLVASIFSGIWFVHTGDPQIRPWVCAAVNATFLFWWIFTIKSSWVKIPAFAYAERLFESTEQTKIAN